MAFQTVRVAIRRVLNQAASTYIVGGTLPEAIRVARSLEGTGVSSTVAFWDGPGATPRSVAAQYFAAAERMGESLLDSYVSVKAPSLGYDAGLLRELLARGSKPVRVHFDSLGWEATPRILRLIDQCPRDYARLSLSLPGAWKRSLHDAEMAVERGFGVRLVKGQWPDRVPKRTDPGMGMLELSKVLAGRARRVAVASHDPAVVRESLSILRQAGTPCELELLYGLPSNAVVRIAREWKIPIRMYLPYGHAWLPYALREAARRPRILYWVVRDAFAARRALPGEVSR